MTDPLIFTPEYYQRMRSLERLAWWNAGMRDIAQLLLDLAPLGSSGVLLDVGCGSGQTIAWFLTHHPGWRAFGLDLAAEGLVAGRSMGTSGLMRASALDLPAGTATVDLIISFDVLQHLPLGTGDERALAEMARALKPGGHLLLRTNAQTIPRTPDDPEFDFHRYTSRELRSKLTAGGFEVIRLGRVNALLGLAEIPGDVRARRHAGGYTGLHAQARQEPGWLWSTKRRLLQLEGLGVRRGLSWPMGRTLVALARLKDSPPR